MKPDDLFRTWRETLAAEIPRAAKVLETRGEPLRAFALVTDEDLRTVYAAGYTAEGERVLEERDEGASLYPPEWPETSSELERSSKLQSAYCDVHYSTEGSEVGPGDDHLRPWKKRVADEMGAVLAQLRADGVFQEDCVLVAWTSDADELLADWLDAASRAANSPGRFDAWMRGE